MAKRLLVGGTSSDAGKTTVVAGICRSLHRQGIRVAPFKAQNMSLNSFVTADGSEIGRAQAMQAQACGIEPTAAMNPVLLKPGSDSRSHAIVLGKPVGNEVGSDWFRQSAQLLPIVTDAFESLACEYDVVICEGAGSIAEINLRENDIVNLGFARATKTPILLLTDIDRGGSFASLVGSLALLDAADQNLIRTFAFNRFRGDLSLLQPGLEMLQARTGRPTVGVVPYADGLVLDAEDAISIEAYADPGSPLAADVLRVAVVAYPRMSNFTDLDPLAQEPGVAVTFVRRAEQLAGADLVVLPGTRSTVADLEWLRKAGFAERLAARAAAGQPVLGICGGYQMLGATIDDPIESRSGISEGLGLLPIRTTFTAQKTLTRSAIETRDFGLVTGYEIHHGQVEVDGDPWLDGLGVRRGCVSGTLWHGVLESDRFRRAFLNDVTAATGRQFRCSDNVQFAAVRERRIDMLADLIETHLDLDALHRLLDASDSQLAPLPRLTLTLD